MTDITPCPMCGRPVRVVGHPDFVGDPCPHTFHYEPVPSERERALEAVAGEVKKMVRDEGESAVSFAVLKALAALNENTQGDE